MLSFIINIVAFQFLPNNEGLLLLCFAIIYICILSAHPRLPFGLLFESMFTQTSRMASCELVQEIVLSSKEKFLFGHQLPSECLHWCCICHWNLYILPFTCLSSLFKFSILFNIHTIQSYCLSINKKKNYNYSLGDKSH